MTLPISAATPMPPASDPNVLRPKGVSIIKDKTTVLALAFCGANILRGVLMHGASTLVGAAVGFLVMVVALAIWRRNSRITFDGNAITLHRITGDRVIARRGQGMVLAAEMYIMPRTLTGQLWVPDAGTRAATPKQRARLLEHEWDLEHLNRWRAALDVPLFPVEHTLSSQLIEQHYPGTINRLELHPIKYGVIIGLALPVFVIVLAIIAAIVSSL